MGNTAQHCRSGLFQDSDFAGDLEDSQSKSCGVLCIFGSRTFVPLSWICRKQISVSHSCTESEVISLDAGLRMDGLLALNLWDLVISVSAEFVSLHCTMSVKIHTCCRQRQTVHTPSVLIK